MTHKAPRRSGERIKMLVESGVALYLDLLCVLLLPHILKPGLYTAPSRPLQVLGLSSPLRARQAYLGVAKLPCRLNHGKLGC